MSMITEEQRENEMILYPALRMPQHAFRVLDRTT